jgi:hypothetical protein
MQKMNKEKEEKNKKGLLKPLFSPNATVVGIPCRDLSNSFKDGHHWSLEKSHVPP